MIAENDVAFALGWCVQQSPYLSWAHQSPSPENEMGCKTQRFNNSLTCWTPILSWISCDEYLKKPRSTICREKKKEAWIQKGAKARDREKLWSGPWFQFISELQSGLTSSRIMMKSPSALAWASSSSFLLLATQRILSNPPWIIHP